MTVPLLQDFIDNVEFEVDVGDSTTTISCKKGLWSVTSPDALRTLNEAFHYFEQYWEDGEYEDATN